MNMLYKGNITELSIAAKIKLSYAFFITYLFILDLARETRKYVI